MEKIRKITGGIAIITLAAALLYMGIGIQRILAAGPMTSFPWYTACYFTAIYFGPTLLVEISLFAVFSYYCRKTKE